MTKKALMQNWIKAELQVVALLEMYQPKTPWLTPKELVQFKKVAARYFRASVWTLVLFCFCSCSAPGVFPPWLRKAPPNPKRAMKMQSMPVRTVGLIWDWQSTPDNPPEEVVFVLESSTNLANWSTYVIATNQTAVVRMDKAREFFKVYASNVITGETSRDK